MDGVVFGRGDETKLKDLLDLKIDMVASGEIPAPAQPPNSRLSGLDYCQWQLRGNGSYFPCGKTVATIPAGNYWPQASEELGPYLQLRPIINDNIIEMPDSASTRVLAMMEKFWNSKERYQRFGLLFKRGILLWGPPGSGKTVTVRLLSAQVIARNGIVIHTDHPGLLENILRGIRAIEPVRPIIVIYEDIDELIHRFGEHTILSILDGEMQLDNVVHIATTNYPDRLGARIVNRPSRFDDRVLVDMPNVAQRAHYLQHVCPDNPAIATWVKDTEGLSIAHLRELVAAVYCLESDYTITLARLREMNERPETIDGFEAPAQIGLTAKVKRSTRRG
jgi:hypothetical protein